MDTINRKLKKLVENAKQEKEVYVSYMLIIYFLTLSSRKLVYFLLEVLMHL
jgi:hypothetical protein